MNPLSAIPCLLERRPWRRSILAGLLVAAALAPSAGWAATLYTYDELNRLTKVVYDDGRRIEYGYDAAGNLLSTVKTSPQASPLFEDFLGVVVDASKWTTVGLGDGNPAGAVTVADGLATFPAYTRLSTEGKLTVSGRKIVVESRMAGLGGSRDTSIYLVDTDTSARNLVMFGDTTYYSAMYAGAYGIYSGSTPALLVTSGTSTNQWMEYRFTLDGDQATVERGPTLAQIDASQTRTLALARSIEGRSFFVNIGTGGPAYSPGTFDWVRVTITP